MNKNRCLKCHYDEPNALQQVTLCAECTRLVRGKPIVEWHHVLGRAVSEVVAPVPANLHAFLSACQREYPAAIRQPDHPLLYIALVLQSAGDFYVGVKVVSDHRGMSETELGRSVNEFCAWAAGEFVHLANWLMALHSWLAERYGEGWFEGNDLYPLEHNHE